MKEEHAALAFDPAARGRDPERRRPPGRPTVILGAVFAALAFAAMPALAGAAADPAGGPVKPPAPRAAAVGPPLTALGKKIASPDWLVAWLIQPSRLRPGTAMPDAGMTPAEAQAVARYLLGPAVVGKPGSAAKGGDAKIGERLFVERGCRGCHAVKHGEPSISDRVPNLYDVGLKVRPEWLAAWLEAPRAYDPHTLMPKLELSPDDVRHLVAFLSTRREGPGLPADAPRFKVDADAKAGRAAIERYECAKCHAIEGFPPPPPAYQLSASREPTPEEVRRDGELLVATYNCRGCHKIDGQGGAIASHLERAGLAPPTLEGVGARLQPSWLVGFLQHPKLLRPWLAMRMPEYGFQLAEAQALARYFALLASVPASEEKAPEVSAELADKGLRRLAHFKCTQCHLSGAEAPPGTDPEDLAIDLTNARTRLRPSWVPEFLARPKQIVGPQTRMPTVFFTVDGRPKVAHPDEDIAAISAYLAHMTEPPSVALARLAEEQKKEKAERQPTDWTTFKY